MKTYKKLNAFIILAIFTFSMLMLPASLIVSNSSVATDNDFNIQDDVSIKNNPGLSASSAYDGVSGTYSWWNPDFTYRVPIEINSSYIDRQDYSVTLTLNFTKYLFETGWSDEFPEFNPYSVRVIEYEEDTTNQYIPVMVDATESDPYNKSIVPSLFIPLMNDNYDAIDNAIGQLKFEMDGLTAVNTNRTYMVYFDTVDKGHTLPVDYLWNKDYNANSDVIGEGNFNLAYSDVDESSTDGYGYFNVLDDNLNEYLFQGVPNYNIPVTDTFASGDFDGDGNVEVVVFDLDVYCWLMDYNMEIDQWVPYQSVAINWRNVLRETYPSASFYFENVYAADIDHDGADEIIVADYYGYEPNAIFILNFTNEDSVWSINLEQTIEIPDSQTRCDAIYLADFDHNGFQDIYIQPIGGASYEFHVLFNNGTNDWNVTTWGNSTTTPYDHITTSIGDIDNDGNIEVVMCDSSNDERWYFWQFNETGQFEFEQILDLDTFGSIEYEIAGAMYDWDNDGYTEIIVTTRHNSYRYLKILRVLGDESKPTEERFQFENVWGESGNDSIPYSYMYYPEFGDVDNDGEVDMITPTYYGYPITNVSNIMVWDQDSISPKWMGDTVYRYSGTYYRRMQNTQIFGGWSNEVYRQDPQYYIWEEAGDVKAKDPDLIVRVIDKDMGPVPGAEVQIKIESSGLDERIGTTDTNGEARFSYLQDETYDIIVNYTSTLSEETVYTGQQTIDSASSLEFTHVCLSELRQIEFEIVDEDGNPFTMGNLKLYNDTWGTDYITEIDLTNDDSLVWVDREAQGIDNEYNFTIEYDNALYEVVDVKDDTASLRDNLEYEEFFNATPSTYLMDDDYKQEFTYTVTDYVNWVNISISDVNTNIDRVDLYYEPESGTEIYTWDELSVTDWNENVYLWNYSNGELRGDVARTNEVKIVVYCSNNTINDGKMNVTIGQKLVKPVTVPMASMEIQIFDEEENPIEAGVLIPVFEDYDSALPVYGQESIINLTTNSQGYAVDAEGNDFYYLTKDGAVDNYSIEAIVYDAKIQFYPIAQSIFYGNFSFTSSDSTEFQVQYDTSKFENVINLINSMPSSIDFDEDWLISCNITADNTEDLDPAFLIAADVTLNIYSVLGNQLVFSTTSLSNPQTGIYQYSFNPQTEGITLTLDNYQYVVMIEAATPGYGESPESFIDTFAINPFETDLTILEDGTIDQTNGQITKHWGETFNLSVFYESDSNGITGISPTLEWEFESATMTEDPSLGDGYYTYEINTSLADNLGTYRIDLSAFKTNYEEQSSKYVNLIIEPILTQIGANYTLLGQNVDVDSIDNPPLPIQVEINVTDTFVLSYLYQDMNDDAIVGADSITYSWFKSGTTERASGDLIDAGNGYYTLDIDTETLTVGTYTVIVNIQKEKYTQMQSAFVLTISSRTIAVAPEGSFEESGNLFKISQTKDNVFELSVDLRDMSRNGVALTGATVNVTLDVIGFVELTDVDNDGIYTATISVDDINAFFAPETLTGTLRIWKDTFTAETKAVTVTVEMDQIFEGIPMFYFFVGIALIVVLVGGIGGYRYVQYARIPEYIKKCDETAKTISKKKSLKDIEIVENKVQYLVSQLGSDWAAVGLDFEGSFDGKKKKVISLAMDDENGGN